MWRIAAKALGILAAIVLLAAFAGYLYLRRSLPLVEGEIAVAGLSAAVDIDRDSRGVPHIRAANRRDALFGLGYAHAQDRLWQMEFQRRIAHGRLSEIFGSATVAQDRFLRTLGTGRAAEAAWEQLPDDARADIEAYITGVNAFLAMNQGSRLPPEFAILRFEPAPWTGPDVIGWVKMMAWDLSANYSTELLRHDVVARVGLDRAAQLMPPLDPASLAILPATIGAAPHQPVEPPSSSAASSQPAGWASAIAESVSSGHPFVRDLLLGGARTEALGSNNWVVSGDKTATGFPLLANDPHLGTRIPSVWYLARLSGGSDFNVAGATLPGAPGVALGRNQFIAWGATNVAADVQDFFLERLDPSGTRAEFQGQFEPLRIIPETIEVRGAEPVSFDVRLTRHGPLVSDAINANAAAAGMSQARGPLPALALRWTALDADDTTVAAFLRLNGARNWNEFTEALRLLVVPSQNFVYADRDGHIGYYAPGRVPIRARGDGRYPADGWSGEMEWLGVVPFDELPHAFDPPEGVIITANHQPAGALYPHLIGTDFPQPYRADRIRELLEARNRFTPDDFAAIQADTVSLHARDVLPRLLAIVEGDTDEERAALDRLRDWDFNASGESRDAALFTAWFLALAPAIAGDELGPDLLRVYEGRFSFITRFVVQTLAADPHAWCDDTRTQAAEDCSDAVSLAFRTALERVSETMGPDSGRWRWDTMHRATFPHQGLDAVSALRPFFSRSVPGQGDWSTVNVGPVATDQPFQQRSIASYRHIVDLSPADDSRFADAVGQSGHFLSTHFDDALEDWRAVRHLSMNAERDQPRTLRLIPSSEP